MTATADRPAAGHSQLRDINGVLQNLQGILATMRGATLPATAIPLVPAAAHTVAAARADTVAPAPAEVTRERMIGKRFSRFTQQLEGLIQQRLTTWEHQAQLEQQTRTIAELRTLLQEQQQHFQQAEMHYLEALKAKENDLHLATTRGRGTERFKQLEQKYALELAHLQLLVGQKEAQIQDMEQQLLAACQQQASSEQYEQRIADLHLTVENMRRAFMETEAYYLTALQAKEEGFDLARQDQAVDAQHAQQLAQFDRIIRQKEAELQQVTELQREQLQQLQRQVDEALARAAELAHALAQQEQASLRQVGELQQQLRASQQTVGKACRERDVEFLRDFLASCPLFKNLTPLELSLVAGLTTFEMVDAQELIIKQGSEAYSFYIIVSGGVVLAREVKGESKELMELEEGDIFGEGTLINHGRREVTAISTCPTKLLRVANEAYKELVESNLPLARKLPANLLRIVNERSFIYA